MRRRCFTLKKFCRQIVRKGSVSVLILAQLLYVFGALDLYFAFHSPFAPNQVDAAYGGKHLRTVEFVLGGGGGTAATQTGTDAIDTPVRASDANVYAGNQWNTTKNTAGTKSLVIPGSGIRVLSAFLDITANQVTANVDVSDLEITMDVNPGPYPGEDIPVTAMTRNGAVYTYNDSSGLSSPILSAKANVTSLFQVQTDADWNAGVSAVGMLSITGPAWRNATMKLVITYEQNYSLTPHTELKTVRFPLRSTAAGDSGSVRGNCVAATTCSFQYSVDLPDLANMSDVMDVWFELSFVEDGAATTTVSINGGAAGVAHGAAEVATDGMERFLIYRPSIGAPNFATSTQQLDVAVTGTNIGALGGEVVVTYKFNTGATTQVETVQYWMGQAAALPTTSTTTFTQYPSIANASPSIRNIWYRVHDPVTNTPALRIGGKVGNSATTTVLYAPTLANPRGGTLNIIHDVGTATTSWSGSSGTLSVEAQHAAATYDAPPGAEAMITFYWAGANGGTVTQTGRFFAGSSGAPPALASRQNSFSFEVDLPETVTKTLRSSYLSTSALHTNAGTITAGTVRVSFTGTSSVVISEATEDTESYRAVYVTAATSTGFTPGNTIPWNSRIFQALIASNQANEFVASTEMVVTYDADLELLVPHFNQNYFRIYVDNDAVKPTDPWPAGVANLGENADVTNTDIPPGNGTNVRIRVSLRVSTTSMLAASTQFKLQYGARSPAAACSSVSSWSDLGAPASGSVWRGVNGTPADGTSLSGNPPTGGDLLLSVSDRAGSYSEQNNTVSNPFTTAVGEDVEYDWNVESNNAATNTPYCFRMVKADGTVFEGYDNPISIWTAGYTPETRNWRWYDDETNANPSTPLSGAGENVAPSNVANGNIVKLRITIAETNGSSGVAQQFKVQYSQSSNFDDVHDVGVGATCPVNGIWCYGDGVDSDGAAITGRVLTDSTANGTHNESSTTVSGPLASTATEYEFTLKQAGARVNSTYYFRLWDITNNHPVALGASKTYPSLSTEGAIVTSTVSSVATSTVSEGVTSDVTTYATQIPFGRLAFDSTTTAIHQFVVTTDATNGYELFLYQNQDMTNDYGNTITPVTGTNAIPTTWATGCSGGVASCFGYHTGDDTLSNGSTRFLLNDTYAALTSSPEEIGYNSGPVTNESIDVVFRIKVTKDQPAGVYTNRLTYIVVPIF